MVCTAALVPGALHGPAAHASSAATVDASRAVPGRWSGWSVEDAWYAAHCPELR